MICDLKKVAATMRAAVAEAVAPRADDNVAVATNDVMAESLQTEKVATVALTRLQAESRRAAAMGDGVKVAKIAREIIDARKAVSDAAEIVREVGAVHEQLYTQWRDREKISREEKCRNALRLIIAARAAASAEYDKLRTEGESILREIYECEKAATECKLSVLQAFAATGATV